MLKKLISKNKDVLIVYGIFIFVLFAMALKSSQVNAYNNMAKPMSSASYINK